MTDTAKTTLPARRHRDWPWSLIAGLVFAVIAYLSSILGQLRISPTALGKDGEITTANMLVGVFLSGWLVWWLLVSHPRRATLVRGAVAGILVACLSYPAVLLLAEFVHSGGSISGGLPEVLRRTLQVLVQSGFALLTTGFASTIVLALAGMLIAYMQRRAAGEPAGGAAAPDRHAVGFLGVLFKGVVLAAGLIVAMLVAAFIFLTVLPIPQLAPSTPAPAAKTYAQALAGFAVIEAHEATLPLRPECRSQLRTHGDRVGKVLIYFHGLTSCPAQGDTLAGELYGLGFNVLVPRLPGHGELNSLTHALATVTAEDFVNTADTAIAIAHGLGDDVIIMGLSAGGTITTFETQQASFPNAIAVAPFLGPASIPPWATRAATNLLLLVPNRMMWWNSKTPYSSPEMPYVYPQFATRVIGQLMRLGRIVAEQAAQRAPSTLRIGVLLNDADRSINNKLVEQLVSVWRADGATVDLRFLPEADGLPHDVIDPHEPHGDIGIVYPILLEMLSENRQ